MHYVKVLYKDTCKAFSTCRSLDLPNTLTHSVLVIDQRFHGLVLFRADPGTMSGAAKATSLPFFSLTFWAALKNALSLGLGGWIAALDEIDPKGVPGVQNLSLSLGWRRKLPRTARRPSMWCTKILALAGKK